MRTRRRSRRIAIILTALSVPLSGPAAALAVPADFVKPAPRVGDTPSEFGQTVAAAKAGDTPADYPGASRSPKYTPPTTVEVVRPERTIVRDTDPVLPTALAALALLVALGLAGTALIRVRSLRLG